MATITSQPANSSPVRVTTTLWWELDPTDPSTAVAAQPNQWQPVNTEQATAHAVMGVTVLNVVSSVMMEQDFSGTFEIFDASVYTAFQSLLTSGKVVFISSPWGTTDSGWFRIGPASGGLSTGAGVKAKNTQLMPSTANAPHRTVQITAVAAPRPTV